jgi:prepilin-type processing-associated H-X9-DG protein
MRRMVLAASLVLVGAATATAAERLEDRFGKDYLLLVSVNDAAAFKIAFEKTALWATWRDPEVQRFLEPQLPQIEAAIRQATGLGTEALTGAPPGQVVFGVAPPPIKPAPTATQPARDDEFADARFVCLIRLGAAKANSERLLEQARKERRSEHAKRLTLPDGTLCEQLGMALFVATKGDLLGITNHPESLGAAWAGPLPADKRLTETDACKGALKPFGAQAPEGGYLFLDLAGVIERLDAEGEISAKARAVLDRLGILQMKGVGLALRPVGRQMLSQCSIYAPGWTRGLLTPFGRGARALLKTVPAEADGAVAWCFDSNALYDVVRGGMEAGGADEALNEISAFFARPGGDLLRDLLTGVAPQAVYYTLPLDDPPATDANRVVVEVPLKDRATFLKAVDTLAERLVPKASPTVQYQRAEAAGVVWHSFSSTMPPLQLAIGIGENRLVLATRMADAEAAFARAGKPLDRSFLDRPNVAAALDRVGADGALLAGVDEHKELAALYEMLLTNLAPALLGSAGSSSLPIEGAAAAEAPEWRSTPPAKPENAPPAPSPLRIPGFGPLPSAEAVTKHVTTRFEGLTVSRDGLVFTCESFSGGSMIVTPVMAAVVLPALARAREAARLVACMSNLRMIGLATFQYAADKNDRMPASLDDLKPYLGKASDEVTRCTKSGGPYRFTSYAGRKLSELPPDLVLAYDANPVHMGRRNVSFLDGHCEALQEARFREVLEQSLATTRPK